MNTISKMNGALLINLNIVQSVLTRFIQQSANEAGLNINPVEVYILSALLDKDGVFASALAAKVGRAATSFTPNLDKLQDKGFIYRKPDATDRRAVNIHLTDYARGCADTIRNVLKKADDDLRQSTGATEQEWAAFNKIIGKLQGVDF